jgi:hypothetical protein
MFNRMALFALAAIAAIVTTIVAPTTASAWGGNGSHFGRSGGGHFGARHFGGMRFGQRFGRYHNWSRWSHYRWSPWSRWSRYHWYSRPYFTGYRPYAVGGFGGGGGGDTDTGPAPRPTGGNCLTKQYMQDGTAVFQDRCTGEEAAVTNQQPPEQQPQQGPGPRRFGR